MEEKVFRVSYGFVGNAELESYISYSFFSKEYNGGFVTLDDAVTIFELHAQEENADVDYDEFLPICVEVQYFPDVKGHILALSPIHYVIYDGNSWFIPLKEDGRVKKVGKNEAIEWIENYMKAVKSYEERVNSFPAASIETIMFGEDKAAYPTKKELAAMPKAE